MQLVYDTSGCSSQGFSWSPSNRYLNRSKLASTRLCNNHIIIIKHQHFVAVAIHGFQLGSIHKFRSGPQIGSHPLRRRSPLAALQHCRRGCQRAGCCLGQSLVPSISWSPSNRYLIRSKLASTRLCDNHIITIISCSGIGSHITTQ